MYQAILLLSVGVVAYALFLLARRAPMLAYFAGPGATLAMVSVHTQLYALLPVLVLDYFLWPWALYACIYHRHRNGLEPTLRMVIRGTLWFLGFAATCFAPFAWAGVGVLFPFLYIGLFLRYRRRLEEARVAALLGVLRSCMKQRQALAPAIREASKGEEEPGLQIIMERLSTQLESGKLLSEALRRSWLACPGHLLALIQAGERTHQVTAAVEKLHADLQESLYASTQDRSFNGGYLVMMLLLLTLNVGALTVWVFPTLKPMFEHYGGQLPASTQLLINIVHFITRSPWSLLLLPLPILYLWLIYRPFFFFRHNTFFFKLRWLTDTQRWFTPLWRKFELDISMLQLVETLRFGIRSGCTLPDVLESALELDVNLWFHGKIKRWREAIVRGEDPSRSAKDAGLGSALAWAFEGGSHHTEETLATLESLHRSNLHHRHKMLRTFLFPAAQLCIGLLFAFVLVAAYLPLFTLAGNVPTH